MQRRKFLATVGSLTAGSAAALGTGAVSPGTSFDRQSEFVVAETDSGGIITLQDAYEGGDSDIVHYDQDGALHIDISETGFGLNPEATFKFDPLFKIGNQESVSNIISFDYEFEDPPNPYDLVWVFSPVDMSWRGHSEEGDDPNDDYAMHLSGDEMSWNQNTYFELGPGSMADVSLTVKTNGKAGEDLSGTMEFEVVDEFPEGTPS